MNFWQQHATIYIQLHDVLVVMYAVNSDMWLKIVRIVIDMRCFFFAYYILSKNTRQQHNIFEFLKYYYIPKQQSGLMWESLFGICSKTGQDNLGLASGKHLAG